MTIGWPIAASISGRFYLTIGFRLTLLMGALFAIVGALLLLPIDGDSSIWALALPCFVMGLGFGFVASPAVIAAQSTVSWRHRGVVTGATMFSRSVGSALGVAVLGAIANGEVRSRLGSSAAQLEHVAADVLEPALHDVFLASACIAVTLLVIGAFMPARVVEHDPAT
jgi:MFS family permease